MRKKKILCITNMFPHSLSPYSGVFVQRTNKLFKLQGFQVNVVALGHNVGIKKILSYISWWIKTYFIAMTSRNTIIHIHFVKYGMVPFLLWSRKALQSVVLNFHGTDLYTNKVLTKLMRWFVPRVRKVIAPSAGFVHEIQRVLDIKLENVFVYPSGGVNTLFFSPGPSIAKDTELTIGFVGNIITTKGWRELLAGVAMISVPLTLIIIGSGSDAEELENYINRNTSEQTIRYIGPQYGETLRDFIRKFHIFVFPSHAESLGLAGLEAMACGVPVIGTRVVGISSYLNDGLNGFTCNPRDPVSIRDAVIKWINLSDDQKAAMRWNARETALQYDSAVVGASLVKEFENL